MNALWHCRKSQRRLLVRGATLTLEVPIATVAENILTDFFFFFFSYKLTFQVNHLLGR